MLKQELTERGDELQLVNHINTDEAERENWRHLQEVGKGFIRENGEIVGREVARIPNDKAAFRRLLKRYPHWRCSEGSV